MALSLDHMDYILGFEAEPPALVERKSARADGAFCPPAAHPADFTQQTCQLSGKRVHDDSNERAKKRRAMTTEEKVRKFLDTGAWNMLLPKHESALSEEVSSRVASAAAGLGLPSPQPPARNADADVDADADTDTDPDDATETVTDTPAPLSKPVYKSIDNLLCLAVAAPIHCGQHHTRVERPAPQNTTLTSNASFCRTPDPLPTAAGTAPALPDASPSVPSLQSPARPPPAVPAATTTTTTTTNTPTAATPSATPGLSPAVPIEMGMPTMWRSHSGTQLSCY